MESACEPEGLSAYKNGQGGTGLIKHVHCRAVSWKQLVAVAQIGRMGNCFVLEETVNYVWDLVKFVLLSLLTD